MLRKLLQEPRDYVTSLSRVGQINSTNTDNILRTV
ncbi:hypothetical protein BQ8482_111663 [Mesorhizobium delmotii]|uniref:Uncharacterized protein n=1 Tax=Mesorhizobium delmotii TaxID=1631247 RepID=A0A2P9AF20_9HYPH|nr:hypothetical protein BQ8482_111663 [Mesorhizobium delmotii]